jgi:hypothetical protein
LDLRPACLWGLSMAEAKDAPNVRNGNFISLLDQGSQHNNVYHLWCDDIFSPTLFCYVIMSIFLCSESTLDFPSQANHSAETVLAAAEDPQRCRRRARADNVLTSPSISPSHGASHPIDQRPDIWHSRPKSSSSTRR